MSTGPTEPIAAASTRAVTRVSAPRKRVVGHQHPARGPHREPAADGGHGDLGTHRDEHDLAAVALDELQRALEPVLVAGVERSVGAFAHEQMVLAEPGRALRLGNPLDQHGDVHGPMLAVATLGPTWTGATGATYTWKTSRSGSSS